MNQDSVVVFDTTLRDGEQCPGASMTIEEKLQVAERLQALRVDIIEAGFPIASDIDFAAVRAISEVVHEPIICALSRASRVDIDRAAQALRPAKRKRLHTFISTSPIHMKFKLRMEPEQVIEAIADSVRHARNLFDDVEWSCEDGTRSDYDFLCRCFETAIRNGAKTVNIADTVGYALPNEFGQLVHNLIERVPGMDSVVFSVHCHDDLGLATANSLAAIVAGARQVECTINGLGERAGNASLEEIVMAIKTRGAALKKTTQIRTEEIFATSRLVEKITGFAVPPNKSIVGSNAFAHESGIHQHGVIMHKQTYEIMEPKSVGASNSRIVMGRHSGRHGLMAKLEALDNPLSGNEFEVFFQRFQKFANGQKSVSDAEILSLIRGELEDATKAVYELLGLQLESTADGNCRAIVQLSVYGEPQECSGESDSWSSAAIQAISRILPEASRLDDIRIENVSQGPSPMFSATARTDSSVKSSFDRDPTKAVVSACILALSEIAATKKPARQPTSA